MISGLLIGSSIAQETATYQSEYSAFTQAIENGDREGAERHGRAAWQLAEETLGDHQLTGVLAFNYGQLVLFTDAKEARTALQRADQLQRAGFVNLPKEDLQLFLAFTKFMVDGERRRDVGPIRNQLDARIINGDKPTPEVAKIWLHVAFSDHEAKFYPAARKSAVIAERAIAEALPDDYRGRAQAIIIGAVSILIPQPRSIEEIQRAHNELTDAMRLFPPQKDIESFDPILAEVIAWDGLTFGAILSMNRNDYPDHENMDFDDPKNQYPTFIEGEKSAAACNIAWSKSPIDYPSEQARDAHMGAVVIGFDLPNDRPTNIKLLAEVPGKGFGASVLRNVHRWRLATPQLNEPACKANRILSVTFSGTKRGRISVSGG